MGASVFRSRVAVITGAGSGIGRALAVQLAHSGARLALSDIDAAALAQTVALLPAGTEARTYAVDVARRDQVFAHADEVRRDFGTAHLVINNAGVALIGTIANSSVEEFEWQLAINLWGVIYGTKAFLPMLLAQNDGHIVNLSSALGLIAVPCSGAYIVSKFGVRGFTECLARELHGTGVKASCVHPGGINTGIGAASRKVARAGREEDRIDRLMPAALITPPDECARDILAGVARGRQRILVGSKARGLDWLQRLLPGRYGDVLRVVQGW